MKSSPAPIYAISSFIKKYVSDPAMWFKGIVFGTCTNVPILYYIYTYQYRPYTLYIVYSLHIHYQPLYDPGVLPSAENFSWGVPTTEWVERIRDRLALPSPYSPSPYSQTSLKSPDELQNLSRFSLCLPRTHPLQITRTPTPWADMASTIRCTEGEDVGRVKSERASEWVRVSKRSSK